MTPTHFKISFSALVVGSFFLAWTTGPLLRNVRQPKAAFVTRGERKKGSKGGETRVGIVGVPVFGDEGEGGEVGGGRPGSAAQRVLIGRIKTGGEGNSGITAIAGRARAPTPLRAIYITSHDNSIMAPRNKAAPKPVQVVHRVEAERYPDLSAPPNAGVYTRRHEGRPEEHGVSTSTAVKHLGTVADLVVDGVSAQISLPGSTWPILPLFLRCQDMEAHIKGIKKTSTTGGKVKKNYRVGVLSGLELLVASRDGGTRDAEDIRRHKTWNGKQVMPVTRACT